MKAMLLNKNISIVLNVLNYLSAALLLWFFCSKEAVWKCEGDLCSSFQAAPQMTLQQTRHVFSFEGLSLQFCLKGPRLKMICFVAALMQQQLLLRLAFHKQGEAGVSGARCYLTFTVNLMWWLRCSFKTDAPFCRPQVAATLHVSPWLARGSVCSAAPRTRSKLLPAN